MGVGTDSAVGGRGRGFLSCWGGGGENYGVAVEFTHSPGDHSILN